MTRIEFLLTEFKHETSTARRFLERMPTERFAWKPHARSFTAGQLASHLVDCIRWIAPTFSADELDFDPSSYTPFRADSTESLLTTFDAEVADAVQAMQRCEDPDASKPWRLKLNGDTWFEKPREAVFRDMSLSHLIHHRGQLSVYLRLLDVPLPSAYGPTADDESE